MVKVAGTRRFFVRGHLRIPLIEHGEPWFAWSVWVELEESDFASMMDSWDDADRVNQAAIQATLNSSLPYDAPTVGLPVVLHQAPPGEVPLVSVSNEVHHLIADEQRNGMTLHRLAEINASLL